MKIVLLGGTGFVGRALCEQLVRSGHELSVLTRRLENAKPLQMLPRLQPVLCNVHESAQLERSIAGHDVLINLVAILHGTQAEFEQHHFALPQRISETANRLGIRQVIHVSSLGADHETPEKAPSMYLRSKGHGEQALLASGLNVQIIRPSIIFGEQDRFVNLFAQLQRWLPIMALGGGDAQMQPVWVQDVARGIAKLIDVKSFGQFDRASKAPIYEFVGDQVFRLREIVALSGRLAGVSRPIFELPMPLARLQAALLQRLPGPTLMSPDNLDSLKSPNIASGQWANLKSLGIEPASLALIAATYLRPERRADILRSRAGR